MGSKEHHLKSMHPNITRVIVVGLSNQLVVSILRLEVSLVEVHFSWDSLDQEFLTPDTNSPQLTAYDFLRAIPSIRHPLSFRLLLLSLYLLEAKIQIQNLVPVLQTGHNRTKNWQKMFSVVCISCKDTYWRRFFARKLHEYRLGCWFLFWGVVTFQQAKVLYDFLWVCFLLG